MLGYCWATVCDADRTLTQHWLNHVSEMLGWAQCLLNVVDAGHNIGPTSRICWGYHSILATVPMAIIGPLCEN